MKVWVKYTMAASIFLVGGPGSVAYNQFVSPYMNDQTVYVATANLSADTPITSYDFRGIPLKRSHVSPGAITNPYSMIGLYTTEAMSKNQQFTALTLEPDPLTLTPGTQDVPIPSSWIAAISPTIRQGDFVKIVPMPPTQTGSVPQQSLPVHSRTLNNIPVLYVHTSSNQEVQNESVSPGTPLARDNGSGIPNNIDLKMTNAEADQVAKDVQQGDKLFIWRVTHKTNPVNKGMR